jgi:ankyrin repeat protein
MAHAPRSGADANLGNENQDIPVHLAALANRSDVLEVLLDPSCPTKSNLDAQDAQGYCPLHYACGEVRIPNTVACIFICKSLFSLSLSRCFDDEDFVLAGAR